MDRDSQNFNKGSGGGSSRKVYPISEIYNNPDLANTHAEESQSQRPSHETIIVPFWQRVLYWLTSLFFIGLIIFSIYYIFIGPFNRLIGLPDISSLEKDSTALSSIEVYDRYGKFVCVLQGKEDRQVITLDEVATPLKQALLASEDRSFYQHKGINLFNIMRALLVNIQAGEIRQGASTITQQLVKNVYFKPDEWSTITRKLKEMPLAMEIERKYTKDEILTFYLNRIFWGKNAFGVERAAQRYFNKKAIQLNIAESAYLVALLAAPSSSHQTERAFKVQQKIIKDMVAFGYITPAQAVEALNYKLKFESAPPNLSKHPFYMSVVLEELRSRYSNDELAQGLKIYTSIDPEVQEIAEKTLEIGIKNAPQGITQGALVTIDVESGEVRAIVGGVGDFWEHQWNRATSVHTLGSSIKPFVYLTAFMNGKFSSASKVMDSPLIYVTPSTGEIWEPVNFDKKFRGEITARDALVFSRNIPAIRVAKATGIKEIIKVAEKLGIKGIEPYLSSALGSSAASPLDLANAHAALARGGIYMKPVIINKIVDIDGKVLEKNNNLPAKVIPSEPIYELFDVMTDVVDRGTGRAAKLPGIEIAGKTGTADGSRDIWFSGYTPDTVTVLWGGNDKNEEASKYATGGGVLAGIWKKYMTKYYELNVTPHKPFPKPLPHVKLLVDPITGLKATSQTFNASYREYVPGTEPKDFAPAPTEAQIQAYLKSKEEESEFLLKKRLKNSIRNPYRNRANIDYPAHKKKRFPFNIRFGRDNNAGAESNVQPLPQPPSVSPPPPATGIAPPKPASPERSGPLYGMRSPYPN